uniref:Bromo domain-containing protein n=1 Tax=Rhizophora mucronata TaxID=61149 RepID=A0A2P2LHL0_RHIMU
MDFGTVRKKLSSDAYVNLEQFEKDVFLICSNAMQYNAPDTIYFRQARSIQELAKKNFENLRQDSDDNEPEPKVVRRGRPPMKNFKKSVGRPPSERAGSEFSSDATLAAGGENTIMSTNDLRKGSCLADRSGLADLQFHGSRNEENKLEKNDESAGSPFKAVSMKHVKKQIPLDENRRNTYKQFHASAGGREPSILSTFDAERKQLMAVRITLLPILLFHSLDRKLRLLIAMHGAHAYTWANQLGTAWEAPLALT